VLRIRWAAAPPAGDPIDVAIPEEGSALCVLNEELLKDGDVDARSTRMLALEFPPEQTYETGDHLAVQPLNDRDLVLRFMQLAHGLAEGAVGRDAGGMTQGPGAPLGAPGRPHRVLLQHRGRSQHALAQAMTMPGCAAPSVLGILPMRRRFHSYGPVDLKRHYAVPRTALIEQCVEQLVGDANGGGHFFTIWAPRQTGKTWIMRRAIEEIRARFGERFVVGAISMQDVVLKKDDPPEALLAWIPALFFRGMAETVARPESWEAFSDLFIKGKSPFQRPLILLIDEFDKLPPATIDVLVGLFRGLYLDRTAGLLHGLALVGVRAVLGVDSERGSPFNIQRSLHVPNLTREEVTDMLRQYQEESGQPVDDDVVARLYEVTRGQPGLTGWFGELLTEKYNQAAPAPITMKQWERTYDNACFVEPNNTVLNLIKKARHRRYRKHVVELFRTSNVSFSFDQGWCSYLYLNGVIDYEEVAGKAGRPVKVCRFSSPFIQHRLYNAFSADMAELSHKVPVVDVHDDLSAVFAALDLPALLGRYRDFLRRLKLAGQNPWHGHPGRADLHLREAVGHFHLYWWLMEASGRIFTITPEFPTGNGKVDLLIRHEDRAGVIEVKSFTQRWELPSQKEQAARYARSRGLAAATLVLFVPTDEEGVLADLSREDVITVDGRDIRVITVAIGAV
jgi:hypothetical protein